MLKTILIDAFGGVGKTRVTNDGSVSVIENPHPPTFDYNNPRPFRQYFTSDGTASGSNSMNVDGSTNSVDFRIDSNPNYDIFVKYVSVEILDSGSPNLNSFGSLSALTNGVSFFWKNNIDGLYELHDGIKTNREFIRLGTDTAGIGTGAESYLADVTGGGTDKAYLPQIDFSESYGLKWGIRLRKNNEESIIFRINDNLTGLSGFNAIAYGVRMYENIGESE